VRSAVGDQTPQGSNSDLLVQPADGWSTLSLALALARSRCARIVRMCKIPFQLVRVEQEGVE